MKNLRVLLLFSQICLSTLIVSTSNFSEAAEGKMPCGNLGSIADRILDCGETRTLSNGSRVTTVVADLDANNVLKKWYLDESTGNIWSPPADEELTWVEGINYCSQFNGQNPPFLGLNTWHLPYERLFIEGSDGGEFLTAFNNPVQVQRWNWALNRTVQNKFLYEAFPNLENKDFLRRTGSDGVTLRFHPHGWLFFTFIREIPATSTAICVRSPQ